MGRYFSSGVLVAIALGACEVTIAAEGSIRQFAGRLGVLAGTYESEIEVPGFGEASTDSEPAYGLTTGIGYRLDNFFVDLGLDFIHADVEDADFDRTDVLPSIGAFVGDNWTVFAGYRIGKQGDGLLDDELQDEQGFFFGIGAGGFSLGSFNLGGSVAYNLSEIDGASGGGVVFEDLDYDGVVLKLAVSPKSNPRHSFEVRAQRFNGDGDASDGVTSFNFELTETYLFGSYVYRFAL